MTDPKGSLTGPQFEILELLWASPTGMTVSEIWEQVLRTRTVSRTTILNLVDRLEKREWLSRLKQNGVFRYRAELSRSETLEMLGDEFVTNFFGGSHASLMLSFLGSKRISRTDLNRLREMLDKKSGDQKSKKSGNKRGDRK